MKAVLASILLFILSYLSLCQAYLSNLDVDLSKPTYDQIIYKYLHRNDQDEDSWSSRSVIVVCWVMIKWENWKWTFAACRSKRQARTGVREPESFRQLSLPQIEIPFRDMASIVNEAEAAIINRFEVLEPQIYNSNARQVPKSPEWFMSASSKIKVIAKNMTKVALIAEEASKYLAKAYNLTKDEVSCPGS